MINKNAFSVPSTERLAHGEQKGASMEHTMYVCMSRLLSHSTSPTVLAGMSGMENGRIVRQKFKSLGHF
jgi:hypothetical protein